MRLALAFAALAIVGCRPLDAGAPIDDRSEESGSYAERGQVQIGTLRVIDGDTFEAAGETVRISNIDAPEKPPRSKCMAEAALAEVATRELDRTLLAEWGVLPLIEREGTDRYGRTLARVRLPSGVDVGEEMVNRGVAVRWTGKRAAWCEG